MTVAELIKVLQEFPPDKEVVAHDGNYWHEIASIYVEDHNKDVCIDVISLGENA